MKFEITEEWYKKKIEELGDIDDAITIGPAFIEKPLLGIDAFFEEIDKKAAALLAEQERKAQDKLIGQAYLKELREHPERVSLHIIKDSDPIDSIDIIIPLIRRIMPSLIAEQICSVQPMSMPEGLALPWTYRENSEPYDPLSINEDYIFPAHPEMGRGSLVETLPDSQALDELYDLKYFQNKVLNGLRIPDDFTR